MAAALCFGALVRALGMCRRAAGCAAVAALVAGCGGPNTTTSRSATSTPATSSTAASAHAAPPHRRRPRPSGAPIGATQRAYAGSSVLAATVSRVIDPVTDGGSPAPPGTRPVGVRVTIRDLAGATYDSSASGDWSLLTSAGAASPLFMRHGVCQTPLVDFESLIGAGETRSGCVAFSVRRSARLAAVRFSPHSRAAGAVAWRLR
jgi:hypothetical protein